MLALLVKNFEAQNPNVTIQITWTQMPGIWQALRPLTANSSCRHPLVRPDAAPVDRRQLTLASPRASVGRTSRRGPSRPRPQRRTASPASGSSPNSPDR
jgi:hypothetical protein